MTSHNTNPADLHAHVASMMVKAARAMLRATLADTGSTMAEDAQDAFVDEIVTDLLFGKGGAS